MTGSSAPASICATSWSRRESTAAGCSRLAGKIGSVEVVEQAAIAGALSPSLLADPNRAIEAAHLTAERLNRLAPEHERNWRGEVIAGEGLGACSRTRQGVDERRLIDAALLRSAEARRLDADGAAIARSL